MNERQKKRLLKQYKKISDKKSKLLDVEKTIKLSFENYMINNNLKDIKLRIGKNNFSITLTEKKTENFDKNKALKFLSDYQKKQVLSEKFYSQLRIALLKN